MREPNWLHGSSWKLTANEEMELTANEEMELTAGEGAELATGRGTGLTTELGGALTNLPSEHHRSQPTRCDYEIRKCHSNIPNALTGALGSMGEADAGKVAELTTEEGKWWAGRVTELAWPEGQGMRKWDNRPQTAPLRSANKTQAERAG
jgi:hypothetical protein